MSDMSGGAERLREMVAEATNGPWMAGGYYDADAQWWDVSVDPGDKLVVEGIVEQADARLIALAPELAALVADWADRTRVWGQGMTDHDWRDAEHLLARLDALLPEREPA